MSTILICLLVGIAAWYLLSDKDREEITETGVNYKEARYCLDCGEIFAGRDTCPKCGNTCWAYLWWWLNPKAGEQWLKRLERKAA